MADTPEARFPTVIRRAPRREVVFEPSRRKRPKLRAQSLPLVLIFGFATAILIGAVLLSLPMSSQSGEWTSPLVALFVSTSAVCVTGLTPVDTGTYWSGFGKGVILALFQFGGLGFMTSATLLFLLFGWRVGVRERLMISQTFDLERMGGIVTLVRRAIAFTLIAESAGFVVLTLRFLMDESLATAAWYGLFHSVSAFNNAGFDLFGNFRGLTDHDDIVTLATIAALTLLGSIGYPVIEDLRLRRHDPLTLDTVVVLRTTAIVLAVGFLAILALEWQQSLDGRSVPDKLLQAGFHAVSSRTSGFSTLPASGMAHETLLLIMGLMFIGGASGSTAGGIKVGTLGILLAATWSAVAGRAQVEAAGRELRQADVNRALAVTLLAALLVFVVSVVLTRFESADVFFLMFEATSAFGTTGLSTGITTDLTDSSMLLLTATMFVGRLGPLTLALALVQRTRTTRRRYPEGRVRIG
jgi:trk system potassium uptake protein TrkH